MNDGTDNLSTVKRQSREAGEKHKQQPGKEKLPPTVKGETVVDGQGAVDSRQAGGAVEGAVRRHAVLKEAEKEFKSTLWRFEVMFCHNVQTFD